MGGGALSVEDSCRAEDQGACADRGRPGGALVYRAQPLENLGVAHQGPVALATGHQHDFGGVQVAERDVGVNAESAGVGALRTRVLGDEAKLGSR